MSENPTNANPAALAAQASLERLYQALNEKKNFIFEAGAGAGKTYSLSKALEYLIDKNGRALLRSHKQIACITFTNVAKDQIDLRTDRHPVVHSDTIHAFCWSIIRNFQVELRKILPSLGNWTERIKEFHKTAISEESKADDDSAYTNSIGSGIAESEINLYEVLGKKRVIYDLGYPSIEDDCITLYHDDVLNLTIELLKNEKFRKVVVSRYPVIFIDEYQDTFGPFAEALQTYFITPESGPQIGFFGDHWQKIYGNGCGKIENEKLLLIPKNANFRSVTNVVNILNQMRPELPQEVEDPTSTGSAVVYHTNEWVGTRRTGGHWAGDLPQQNAHEYLTFLRQTLEQNGWDFSPKKTKILMLTHNVLAEEQGYRQLADVFPHNESYIKKEDKYIAFFVDFLEPICVAFEAKKFGEMFSIIGNAKHGINSHADKLEWNETMLGLLELRKNGTIGEMLEYLHAKNKPRFSEGVNESEQFFNSYVPIEGIEEPSLIGRIKTLRQVPYTEVTAFTKFINDYTPFATNHSVKGEEYENVLIVVGRGWNQYNFDQMLGWFNDGIPAGKQDSFERSRNLFYVACSRPIKNMAILFTQQLSRSGLATLTKWFGSENVISLGAVVPTLN